MDVRELQYQDETFDLAVDKSTIDALLCGESSFVNVAKMIKEVQRVLKVGGVYMVISYGQPENRVLHFERKFLDFEISIFTIKKDYVNSDTTQTDVDEKFEKVNHYKQIGTLRIPL